MTDCHALMNAAKASQQLMLLLRFRAIYQGRQCVIFDIYSFASGQTIFYLG